MPCLPNDFPGAVSTVPVLKNFMSLETEDVVAEEVPVALVYNGISHTVMMASPVMLEEFGTGFSLTEGIVESLGDALRPVPDLPATQTFDMRFYRDAVAQLKRFERIGALTGCTHASVWIRPDGTPAGGAEDVGRHVALDKLLGLRAREGWRDGALVVSSRASYEMVQKAAMCGVEILFAVSAPTALAVRTAERCGMTLAAFARAGGPNVYTHPERLVGAQDERLCA